MFLSGSSFWQQVQKHEMAASGAVEAPLEKLKRPPFGKDLFLGVFDTEVLRLPNFIFVSEFRVSTGIF